MTKWSFNDFVATVHGPKPCDEVSNLPPPHRPLCLPPDVYVHAHCHFHLPRSSLSQTASQAALEGRGAYSSCHVWLTYLLKLQCIAAIGEALLHAFLEAFLREKLLMHRPHRFTRPCASDGLGGAKVGSPANLRLQRAGERPSTIGSSRRSG